LDNSKLDYRRYADVLFDVLFAGGQLGKNSIEIEDQTSDVKNSYCSYKLDEREIPI